MVISAIDSATGVSTTPVSNSSALLSISFVQGEASLDLVHCRGNGLLCFVQVESLSGTQVLGGTPGGPQASVPGGASRPGSSAGLAPLESLQRVRKGPCCAQLLSSRTYV